MDEKGRYTMRKIKITADKVLQILQRIFAEEEIDTKLEEGRLQEQLNVKYYTFKHRPQDTENTVVQMHQQGKLEVGGAFCLLSLLGMERVFARDTDIVTVSVNLEYWLQTEKVKFLEELVENVSIETNGRRIAVEIDGEQREIVMAVGAMQITELEEATVYGEMAICELNIDLVFYPQIVSKLDYTVEFAVGESVEMCRWIALPISSLVLANSMTQKSLPQVNRVEQVGNINLSAGRTISLTFDGYVNAFVEEIVANSLVADMIEDKVNTDSIDINKSIYMRVTRREKQYIYACVIKEHTIQIQEDTGNEVHNLTLTARGIE